MPASGEIAEIDGLQIHDPAPRDAPSQTGRTFCATTRMPLSQLTSVWFEP